MANINISQIRMKRGNTAASSTYIGPLGELLVDTGLRTIRIQDGVTAGGMSTLATQDYVGTMVANASVGNVDLSSYATQSNLTAFSTYANLTFGTSSYGNSNVAAYLVANPQGSTYSNVNVQAYLGANVGAFHTYANVTFSTVANAGTQQTQINSINANVTAANTAIGAVTTAWTANAGTQQTQINLINANVTAANAAISSITTAWTANAGTQQTQIDLINANVTATNSAIVTANTGMKSYVDAVTTAWTANSGTQATDINALRANITAANTAIGSVATTASTQQTQINSINANVTAANSAIATLQTQTYSNVNTAAYLAGSVTTGNLTPGNLTVAHDAVILGNLRVQGTQTTVNASTLSVEDLWITVANSAVTASDANGAGLRVDGAMANIAYSSISDSFEFNKSIVVGNVKFSDTTNFSGNTVTLPNTQGFKWNFYDPMVGSDTVTLYQNGLTTGWNSWALTTGDGSNSWILDSDTQEFSLFNGGVNGGKLVFGTAANAGVRSSVDDIEVKSGAGNVFIRANTNPWTFSENGNLILPTRMNFSTSPAVSGTGIVFGDGSYQYTAWTGAPGNELVNSVHTVSLDTTGNLNVPGDILPLVDNLHDLGSATQRFRHLYVGPGTVYVGNAAIKTTATGNLILPGITRAISNTAYAEEVYEEDDQEYSFTTVPTVIDNARYSDLSGRVTGLSFTPAEYSVDQLDGEGFIDGITITNPGSGYSDQVDNLADQDMWATEVATPFASFNANDWVQIPFRVNSRAGESEYEFTQGGGSSDRLVNGNYEVVLDSAGHVNLPGGSIRQAADEDLVIRVKDADDDGYRLDLLVVDENDDNLTRVEVQRDGVEILTNLQDTNNAHSWYFRDDGSTQFPSDTIKASSGQTVSLSDYAGKNFVTVTDTQVVISVQDTTEYEWIFSQDGSITFPDNTVQTTAYTGGGGNVSLPGLSTSGTGTSNIAGSLVYTLGINTESESSDGIQLKVYAGGDDAYPAISIGQDIGGTHRANVVAIGNNDVGYNSLPGGVYIGHGAGFNDTEQPQGLHSIAIGSKAAWDFATNNSITLNATGSELNPDESGLFIKPIREEQYDDAILYYNAQSGEVTYATNNGSGAAIGNTAPTSVNGRLWYNTEDGRTYVYALDTWIDANPGVVPGNMVGYDVDGNITLNEDARINYANGVSIINSVYGDSQVADFLDVYTGNIAKIGSAPLNITAASIKLNSDNQTWTFDNDGAMVFPDGTQQNTAAANLSVLVGNIAKPGAGDGYEFSANVAGITIVNNEVFVTMDQDLFGGPTEGLITIAGVAGMTEANGTWGYVAAEIRDIQLYTTYPTTTPLTGEGWGTYTSGGTAVSFAANPLTISADSITLRTVNNNNYRFDNYGITFPDDTVQTTAYTGGGGNVDLSNYQGNIYINSEGSGLIVDAAGDKRVGFMKYFGIEASFVHANGPTKSIPFQIGRVAADDITRANSSVFTTEIYVSNIGQVGINTTTPAYDLDVSGNVGVSGALLIGDNTTISNDGEFRIWADNDITVYRNGQDGYGVKAGNIETYTDNSLRSVINSNGLEIKTGNLVIPNNGGILYANGTNILSSIPSTGNITFDGSEIITSDSSITLRVPNETPTGVTNWEGGGGWNQGFYGNLATTGGTGTGLTVDVAAGGGGYINIGAITINTPGTGYTDGDVITIDNENNLPGTFTLIVPTRNWNFGSNGATTFPDQGAVTITGDLTVGNLIVNGNTTTINTESYTVVDNIIQMATDNPANTLDLGFVAHRTVNSTLEHTGFVRDASINRWVLFSNVITQPTTTIDMTSANLDDLQMGNITASGFLNQDGSAYAGTYSDTNVSAYLSSQDITSANIGGSQTYANTQVQNISANLGSFQTYANATFSTGGGSTYSNANVASYLPTYSGNIGAGNIVTTGATSGNISGANWISANVFQVSTGIFWANGTAWSSSSGGTTYSSTGAGNVTIVGSAINLTAAGPGAVATGSSTAIPVVTTDAYGRVASITTAAVVAPAGTLTGTTLAATVVTSSLTSVGTLTSLAVTGNITSGNTSATQVTATTGVYSGNVIATNIITTGTYGNITGANVISANTVTVTTYVRTQPVTFAVLPGASSAGAGARAFITDGNTATFGSPVSGSGANAIPIYSNGTNWYVG